MMHLIMRAGRSNKSKQAFYAKVVENLAADPGIDPANVLITIAENHDIDWSFREPKNCLVEKLVRHIALILHMRQGQYDHRPI